MGTEKVTGYLWANADRRRPGYQAPFSLSLCFSPILAAALVRGGVIIASALSFILFASSAQGRSRQQIMKQGSAKNAQTFNQPLTYTPVSIIFPPLVAAKTLNALALRGA